MGKQHPAEQFAKLCEYILGRRPDEFGLVPDENGFVKTKEFLKAASESEGWGHIRQSSINEMRLVCQNPPVEIQENLIRAKDRSRLPLRKYCETPPKLLYLCIRKKSYPTVLEKGVHPTYQAEVVCAEEPQMAEKIGKRRDNQPIRLTVHAQKAAADGIRFYQAGEGLYITDYLPPESFTGPPLPKEPEKPAKPEPPKEPPQPGSFLMTPEKPKSKADKSKPKWKKDKKRARRGKKQVWPDEY
ncbi:MAG: RNA 2'-phosphotransferase [Desulfobacterales bacterium]|nr:RNA 2'-phosphotransferase [Desulfobacterales bacterium]